ncbi:MAG TPA: GlsB/YeaQ/YmgE family stress response membrane protein [Ignavibacteriaceae bacterium]
MDFIWKIIIGLLAGALAKLFMPGKDPGGIIITILLGIGGSIVFSYLGQFLGFYKEGETAGFIGSVLGAMILLFLYRVFIKKK